MLDIAFSMIHDHHNHHHHHHLHHHHHHHHHQHHCYHHHIITIIGIAMVTSLPLLSSSSLLSSWKVMPFREGEWRDGGDTKEVQIGEDNIKKWLYVNTMNREGEIDSVGEGGASCRRDMVVFFFLVSSQDFFFIIGFQWFDYDVLRCVCVCIYHVWGLLKVSDL